MKLYLLKLLAQENISFSKVVGSQIEINPNKAPPPYGKSMKSPSIGCFNLKYFFLESVGQPK